MKGKHLLGNLSNSVDSQVISALVMASALAVDGVGKYTEMCMMSLVFVFIRTPIARSRISVWLG